MYWNNRVIRKTKRVKIGKKSRIEHWYEIHEVFYNDKDKPTSWTTDPITPHGDNLKDLQIGLIQMIGDSIKKPVLEIRNGKLMERK
jgi:hypothetical protein